MDANGGTLALGQIVTTYSKLIVEDYQRPYTWGKEEIEDLFSDLWECMSERSTHFFGTLILQKDDDKPHVKVVDGQQRLTTTFIVVAALRDELSRLSNPVISGGQHHAQVFVPQKAHEYLLVDGDFKKFRLQPNRTVHDLMMECVLPPLSDDRKAVPAKDVQVTLAFRKAVTLIRQIIAKDLSEKTNSEETRLERINEYLDALLKRFLVLRVLTADVAESLDIFLTLNNRGMPLGASDIVRGELLKRIGFGLTGRELAEVHKKNLDEWQEIIEDVQEPEVFLRHFMVSYQPEAVQKKKVVSKVVNQIKATDPLIEKQNAKTFWSDLRAASKIYNQTLHSYVDQENKSQFSQDRWTRLYIEVLHGLMKTHRIFLLNFLKHHQAPRDEQRAEILRLLCVYAIRYNMRGSNAQEIEDNFQSWGREYDQTQNLDLLREHLVDGIEKQGVSAEQFFAADADGDYVTRALLYIVNYHLSVKNWPLKGYHLEHIAPQTPTPGWESEFFAGVEDSELEWSDEVSKLGNLTLLDPEINWRIQNWAFEDKQGAYAQGSTKITDDLLPQNLRTQYDAVANNVWHVDDVTLRTSWLVESFELIFSATKAPANSVKTFTAWKQGVH